MLFRAGQSETKLMKKHRDGGFWIKTLWHVAGMMDPFGVPSFFYPATCLVGPITEPYDIVGKDIPIEDLPQL